MADLSLYYSSGSSSSEKFQFPSKSIGGVLTNKKVGTMDRNLFPPISYKMLNDGSKEYRFIFIKNETTLLINNLKAKIVVNNPVLANVLNPINLTPSPVLGDEWLVPTSAEGLWLYKDGKIATYDGTNWVFRVSNFAKFSVAPETPKILTVEAVDYSVVDIIENGYSHPYGVEFVPLEDKNSFALISDSLDEGEVIGLWIEREVEIKNFVDETDFVLNSKGIKLSEQVSLVFDYDIESGIPSMILNDEDNSQEIALF